MTTVTSVARIVHVGCTLYNLLTHDCSIMRTEPAVPRVQLPFQLCPAEWCCGSPHTGQLHGSNIPCALTMPPL